MSKQSIRDSISLKLSLAFALLGVSIILLSFFFISSQRQSKVTFENMLIENELHEQVSKIKKDVIDLQRNVLIYKETSSKTSHDHANMLFDELFKGLEKIAQYETVQNHGDHLTNISQHLADFQASFNTVVEHRTQRESILNRFKSGLDTLSIAQIESQSFSESDLVLARQYALLFISTNNHEYKHAFHTHIKKLKNSLDQQVVMAAEKESLHKAFNKVELDFKKIVTLTRNYTFLINVVMAGSAQEILFHSRALEKKVDSDREKARKTLFNDINTAVWLSGLAAIIAIIVAFTVPAFISRSVIVPIKKITQIFIALSEHAPVGAIPEQTRSDEIGKLAKAAEVFRDKNEQTRRLLEDTKKSVEQQHALNRELNLAKSETEKALSVKTEFLANMSHELRTPLNSVIGYTTRLLKQPDRLDERQSFALTTIRRNGQHLLGLINDILDFSKMGAGKLALNLEGADVKDLAEEIFKQFEVDAKDKGLGFQLTLPDQPCVAITDDLRLKQILLNLVSNAIKYTNEGSIQLTLDYQLNNNKFIFSIKDTGIGIQEEDMEKLFNRFEQFDENTRFKVGHGTGLGLAIVFKLAELFGGVVQVESKKGRGSEFNVIMPINPEQSLSMSA